MTLKGTFEISLLGYLWFIKFTHTFLMGKMLFASEIFGISFHIISTNDTFRIRFLYDSKSRGYGILMDRLERIKFI